MLASFPFVGSWYSVMKYSERGNCLELSSYKKFGLGLYMETQVFQPVDDL